MSESRIQVVLADYSDPKHADGVRSMLAAYAKDSAGGGEAIPDDVLDRLVPELRSRPYAFSLLAVDSDGQPVGLANCFEGFSTFAGKGLVNIHDFFVAASHRGKGLSQMLLQGVEEEARKRQGGCCKITLEVLSGNTPAKVKFRSYAPIPSSEPF